MGPRDDAPEEDIEPRFLTLEQAAQYLNVKRNQVYALVRSGELPAIKIGGRGVWRVHRAGLDEYVKTLMTETKAWAKANPLNPEERRAAGLDDDEQEPP